MGRLADHLNKKRKTDLDSDADTFAPVSFQLGRRFLETSTDGLGAGATNGYLMPRRVPCSQCLPTPGVCYLCLQGSPCFGHADAMGLQHVLSEGACNMVYSLVFVTLSKAFEAAVSNENPSRLQTSIVTFRRDFLVLCSATQPAQGFRPAGFANLYALASAHTQ